MLISSRYHGHSAIARRRRSRDDDDDDDGRIEDERQQKHHQRHRPSQSRGGSRRVRVRDMRGGSFTTFWWCFFRVFFVSLLVLPCILTRARETTTTMNALLSRALPADTLTSLLLSRSSDSRDDAKTAQRETGLCWMSRALLL